MPQCNSIVVVVSVVLARQYRSNLLSQYLQIDENKNLSRPPCMRDNEWSSNTKPITLCRHSVTQAAHRWSCCHSKLYITFATENFDIQPLKYRNSVLLIGLLYMHKQQKPILQENVTQQTITTTLKLQVCLRFLHSVANGKLKRKPTEQLVAINSSATLYAASQQVVVVMVVVFQLCLVLVVVVDSSSGGSGSISSSIGGTQVSATL
uniref:Uncharacterized protein n=1 Tax=Glossina austeni TaxID=7395 RepID=A0A1A9UMM3_GLOAU